MSAARRSGLDAGIDGWQRVSGKLIGVELANALVGGLIGAALGAALVFALAPLGWSVIGVVVIVTAIRMILAPRRVRSIGYVLREDDLVFRRGILFSRLVAVPYGRMQLVDVNRGPVARLLGLAELRFVTAAATSDVTIRGPARADRRPPARPAGRGGRGTARGTLSDEPVAPPAPVTGGQYLDGAWHHLHPATPLLRGGIGLVAVLVWIGSNLRERILGFLFRLPESGGDPIDELQRHGLIGIAALIVAGVLLVGVGLFWVSWRASDFRIDRDSVTVRRGVLLRTTRTAKLDRIQGVTISRPFFARLVGAARMEMDVAGHDANVRLEYLSNGAAEELRHDVLRLASGRRQAEGAAAVADASADGPTVLAITPGALSARWCSARRR